MLNSNEISEINIVPFVDIVLVLLIIFMATATFAKKESVKVNLPSATTSKNQTSNDKPFVITVTKEGEIYCEEILVKEQNLNECFAKNKSFENGILLRSDLETPFKFVVKVIDECKKNSVEKFALEVKSAKKR
ncbi:MAG: biopolymer transporter ExbD [Sulfurospirillaceae bacterium]|nr:biopolymer transporter ExbD [Sulfurospirillaceae bacterium]MCK9546320.1 biopolymer transporter ExbD [Sulfurospirillaceae bacterium]MDY0237949.1 biopolymer transporter ExbD [Campylobacterales bacterium]NLM99877.1 biopolymer transporter ExbD [Campylobacteraceae bacterium]